MTPFVLYLGAALAGSVPTSSTATVGVVEEQDGPTLELDGLELDEEPEIAVQTTVSASVAKAEIKRKDEIRTDVFADLTDKVSNIVDRTTLGGYGEHWYQSGEDRVSGFRAHRYILFVYSQISERITTATEIEFEFAGSPGKRDGILGFGEVLLEFSVVDFTLADWAVFRAGVILMPVGTFNIRHDAPTRDLTDRPIAYTTIVPSTWFESGAGFYGTIPIGDSQRLTYDLYVVNGLDARIVDGFGFRAARGSHFEDNNHDKAVVGRVGYSPTLGFEVGLSGYTGAYDKLKNRVNLVNLDFTWRLGKLELLGEAVYAQVDEGFVQGFSASSTANTRDAVPTGMFGFYVQANYHFGLPVLWDHLPDWLASATLTGVVRYEGKDTDVNRSSRQGDQRRLTLGVNFRPLEAYVLKTDLVLDAFGVDEVRGAPEVFEGAFWDDPSVGFLASAAYLF